MRMSKKTKEQKLKAEKKRLLELVQQTQTNTFAATSKISYKFNSTNSLSARAVFTTTQDNHVAHDLRKIAVLAAIAFCAQLVLWYLLEKQIIRFAF
jgi:uncharacterized protein YdhG (YjbR/CyaY superfamily)